MASTATLEDLIVRRVASMRASKPPFTDAELWETAFVTITMHLAMPLLSDHELFQVENMLLKATLGCQRHGHKLGEFFDPGKEPGKWFFRLNKKKQQQVTAYTATLLFKLQAQHARLIWCGPRKKAFRFEKPLHPVTSR
jgi:hypothetical protein